MTFDARAAVTNCPGGNRTIGRWLDDPAGREFVEIVREGFEQLKAVASGTSLLGASSREITRQVRWALRVENGKRVERF